MNTLINKLDSPIFSLLTAIIFYLIFSLILLTRINFDTSYIITIGEKFVDLNKLPNNLIVFANSWGYDGQFYFRLAINPVTNKKTDHGITIDYPAYRHQRIVYPLLSWFLTLGNINLLPTIMFLINLVSLSLIGLIGGYLAKSFKTHSLWGSILAFSPGFPYTLSRDLTEILQILFMLLGTLLLTKGKYILCATALTLAVLTKETSLLITLGMFIFHPKRKLFLIPLATFVIWQVILSLTWGQAPIFSASGIFGKPFEAFVQFFLSTLSFSSRFQKISFIQICFLIVFISSTLLALKLSIVNKAIKISYCFYLIMALFYTNHFWVEDISFMRALSEMVILGMLIIISSKIIIKPYILLLTIFIFLISVNNII